MKDRDGLSALSWACHLDHLEHFKKLREIYNVNHPIDPDLDNDGRTWIHWSVRKSEPFQCLNVRSQHRIILILFNNLFNFLSF